MLRLSKTMLRFWNGLFYCCRHSQHVLGAVYHQAIRGHLVMGSWQRPPAVTGTTLYLPQDHAGPDGATRARAGEQAGLSIC